MVDSNVICRQRMSTKLLQLRDYVEHHRNDEVPPIDAKNKLQELYQAQKADLPKYDTHNVGPEKPVNWLTFVTLADGVEIEGVVAKNKRVADAWAAMNALIYLANVHKSSERSVTLKENTVLLVDIENMPNFIDEITVDYKPLTIIGFVGKNHPLSTQQLNNGAIKIISPSTRKDGSDTCMQLCVGYYLKAEAFDTYLIATRDHYGDALVDMITAHGMPWKPAHARVVTSVKQIEETS